MSEGQDSPSLLRILCLLAIILGLGWAVYCFAFLNTSVTAGNIRVNNIGLMAERQNGILFGLGIAIVGTLLGLFSQKSKQ